MDPVYVRRANQPCGIIVSIPHGSSRLTGEMDANRRPDAILANSDWFLNELYAFLHDLQATIVSANYSRYVIDVNRAVTGGSGNGYTTSLVYSATTFGKAIYDSPLPADVIANRLDTVYKPFHRRLKEEIDAVLQTNRIAYLFDLHSFYIQSDADVVLGTCAGRSCSGAFAQLVYEAFASEGFVVKIDEPGLTGGYITSHYGAPDRVEAIQIELRYTAYIGKRAFGEEAVAARDESLFRETQARLLHVFRRLERTLVRV
ncbi:N-formylglutamate amidohydrolase [Paenibacillus lycopersici]|uniref:N-formylglutamate amidohydrolase n=1 Tax=Paenibacillus lycopersici TaxID=2704462 RepID=A0A6C0FUJ5_9BACL|nr:N-formylglutamate amidohydrolase [Paenibacillus lycopersici]QHT60828.1 N-formylglutamate amidohydrolase [Paenibacillus lycopersici]